MDELEAAAGLARELGLWVVVGSSHRLTTPHRPYNSPYVRTKPWRAKARDGAIYRRRYVQDPRSEVKSGF